MTQINPFEGAGTYTSFSTEKRTFEQEHPLKTPEDSESESEGSEAAVQLSKPGVRARPRPQQVFEVKPLVTQENRKESGMAQARNGYEMDRDGYSLQQNNRKLKQTHDDLMNQMKRLSEAVNSVDVNMSILEEEEQSGRELEQKVKKTAQMIREAEKRMERQEHRDDETRKVEKSQLEYEVKGLEGRLVKLEEEEKKKTRETEISVERQEKGKERLSEQKQAFDALIRIVKEIDEDEGAKMEEEVRSSTKSPNPSKASSEQQDPQVDSEVAKLKAQLNTLLGQKGREIKNLERSIRQSENELRFVRSRVLQCTRILRAKTEERGQLELQLIGMGRAGISKSSGPSPRTSYDQKMRKGMAVYTVGSAPPSPPSISMGKYRRKAEVLSVDDHTSTVRQEPIVERQALTERDRPADDHFVEEELAIEPDHTLDPDVNEL
ncbi:hypothetical protein BLNAU_17233 [Blattamonas nauphoetae]|uniref:Uncharacterized protein n=1 Tax=Blattamonas nauphoetae TaxID=2049346 RepID=A0ABQ9X7I8_9EUKA|nr:hypothetical protein BLNAU_17233 [Blattamonas nauphoetae]